MADYIVNGKKVSLSQSDFVAKGGEGSIYERGGLGYKIFHKLKDMIPVAKIDEFKVLKDDRIICPKDVIYDKEKHAIGFTFQFLHDTISLCKLFTTSFHKQNNIENDIIIELVEQIKGMIHESHQKKFLIVDGNELNYLVDKKITTPFMIDVNSWKSPKFPPTAFHPATRDWTTDDFTELTDWFGFAVISFQLFVGIHPFKGKVEGYASGDFRKRVIDCISVMNPRVSFPRSVRDFGLIPSAYKDWYYGMFENGMRRPPPALPGTAEKVSVQVVLIQSTDNFEFRELREYPDQILYHHGPSDVTKTQDRVYIGRPDYPIDTQAEIIFAAMEREPIAVQIRNRKLHIASPKGKLVRQINMTCTDMMVIEDSLYIKNEEKLVELSFKLLNDNITPYIKKTWKIMRKSSQLFSNVVYQSVLGKAYLAIPLPDYKNSSFIIRPIPELDKYKIVDAKYDNHVCILYGNVKQRYDKIKIIFDETHEKYVVRIKEEVDYSPVNFVTLDNGVCVEITEDQAVEVFLNRIDKPDVKRIEDPAIDSDMRLCKSGVTVRFFQGTKIFEMKMK